MLTHVIFAVFTANQSPQTCSSTMYGYAASDINPVSHKRIGWNDGLYGGLTMFSQRHPREVYGVAHRTLPLGSWVWVRNPLTEMVSVLRVIDRGPYWAVGPTGGFIKGGKNREAPGTFTGCLDITYPAGVDLMHRGRQRIQFWPIPQSSPLGKQLTATYGACPEYVANGQRWWKIARKRCSEIGRWP